MLEIFVSKSLVNNLIKLRRKDWGEKLNQEHIFSKIKEILIYDKIIEKNSQINFITIKDKFQGIYISKINKIIYFTQMLNFKGLLRSRNTFVSQNFGAIEKYSLETGAIINISINPFDLNKNPKIPESVKKDFQTLLSLHSSLIINESILLLNIKIFNSLKEYLDLRVKLKSKNIKNNSTYIKIFDDNEYKKITLYGKLDGANFMDTTNACKIISQLNNNDYFLEFIEIPDTNNIKSYTIIKKMGFSVIDISKEKALLLKSLSKSDKVNDSYKILNRNQPLFIRNIIRKYIEIHDFDLNKCFACDYNIESNLVASHIYRYSDIKRDCWNKNMTKEKAAHLITSGENGFFLCPNHDKEFEKGIIIFNIENKKFIFNKNNRISEENYNHINKINNQNFNKVIYTEEFEKNLINHIKRIS